MGWFASVMFYSRTFLLDDIEADIESKYNKKDTHVDLEHHSSSIITGSHHVIVITYPHPDQDIDDAIRTQLKGSKNL